MICPTIQSYKSAFMVLHEHWLGLIEIGWKQAGKKEGAGR